MMGVRCKLCNRTHETPLALHLCSVKIGNKKSVGWCLWCGESLKRGIFCTEQCRISYLNDVHEEEIDVTIKRAKRRQRANRLRIPA